ncbi:uncharacterized protein SPAPADRAFT_60614 [Spathaspora passalidarum NRRL Y-27907]|uniref:Enhancer of mRNA-decapping protein 1 n=1 Tax=Spathaspora passalidarum (strain NRRL Y-27907 / 11-Y1) TaxID=619300 RepID=G3ALN6_SPAPN|nr:uncharacterized protein SPAPADRAFT_60614 [Spathaspora passalidarum NRRL Y-27907]EGW33279.1 hypothetical protein SPAPADRAFT_60614 [Spathaspora passalidarum NRRL Y-27907]
MKLAASLSLPSGEKPDFMNEKPKKESRKKKSGTPSNEASLPNGEKPNFQGSRPNKKNIVPEQSLPNGEKPNFQPSKSKKSSHKEQSFPSGEKSNFQHSKSGSKSNFPQEQSLPSGEKPNFFNEKPTSKKNSSKNVKDKKVEDTYAGSSFHSSPLALNLPKPSFKASPKQGGADDELPSSSNSSVASSNSPVSTHGIAAGPGVPPPANAAPLTNPVTAYPPGSIPPPHIYQHPTPQQQYPYYPQFVQPGFSYQVTPQGYIQYQYPPYGQHHPQQMPQHPIYPHYQTPPPPHAAPQGIPPASQQQQQQPQQPAGGHKITFNELLSSSKN